MRDTPPRRPLSERSSDALLEDLCLALRDVGVGDGYLPGGERVVAAIHQVQTLSSELDRRGFDCAPRLDTLSRETGWLIPPLLEDCMRYPAVLPYVRETDGIRRRWRCQLCREAEYPPGSKLFWFCDRCLGLVAKGIRDREPVNGMVLFRTFNPECRCSHADSETVLAVEYYVEELSGFCEICIEEELSRRQGSNAG